MVIAEFDPKTGLLLSTFEGEVSSKQIIDYINTVKESNAYPRFLKILTDATAAQMNLKENELVKVVETNLSSLEKYDFIIDAIVTLEPKETAMTMLYQELAKTKKYRFEIFSTKEAALSWLQKF